MPLLYSVCIFCFSACRSLIIAEQISLSRDTEEYPKTGQWVTFRLKLNKNRDHYTSPMHQNIIYIYIYI